MVITIQTEIAVNVCIFLKQSKDLKPLKSRRISAGYILKICLIVGLQFSGTSFSLSAWPQLTDSFDVNHDTSPSFDDTLSNIIVRDKFLSAITTVNTFLGGQ